MDATLPDTRIKTIDEVEREHIIAVLRKCKGKVAGIGGAAEKLRIPSTTLNSKIRRLNIQKGYMDGNR
jgi:formate hydrogenlyase transcriptional activator